MVVAALSGGLWWVGGCTQSTYRSPPLQLAAVADFEGTVALDAMPVVRGSVIFGGSTLNVMSAGWVTVRIPAKGTFALWGPGRLDLNDLQTNPRFDIWEGKMMVYAALATMQVVQGSVSTTLPPGSAGFFDRTRFDDYVCIDRGTAVIDSAGHPLAVTGTGQRAFTQAVDGGEMFGAPVSWHTLADLAALVKLADQP